MKKRIILYVLIGLILLIEMVVITGCDENVDIEYYEFCIYTMNADGSDLTKVIDRGALYTLFIPNRPSILFLGAPASLYTVGYDGTNVKKITDTLEVKQEYPTVSLDGEKVVFVTDDDLYVVNINDSNLHRLTHSDDIIERQPSFLPDGNKIIYNTLDNSIKTKYRLCVIDIASGIKDTLLTSDDFINWPNFSADGEKIYYTSSGTEEGLYSMNKDGSNIIKLVSEISAGYPIFISLDKIIYKHGVHYHIVNKDGSNIVDLGRSFHAHIAPFNDKKVVYSLDSSLNGDIYIIDSDSTNIHKLANNGDYPRFSNDGTKIVFSGQYQINKGSKNYITD
jgi:Tol biopolymer transport system component